MMMMMMMMFLHMKPKD
jgi:hypothetical protein